MSDNDAPELTAAGSGKSEAEVAFELLSKLKGQGVWGERNITAILDMYAECLDAAKGLRAYAGQKRVEVPIQSAVSVPAPTQRPAQPQVQAQAQLQAQPPQAAPQPAAAPQAAPQPAAPQPAIAQPVHAQPVHAQQQAVQQAFKQG